ncbi:hypothetical protein BBJ28_00001111 [Nothophytophthora sp. Chile5]|nr:hypothetical protein BBJ28_00001111 [Nothophytophthora sp. Chile5]
MKSHVNWDSWPTYVQKYAARTYQVLTVAEKMSAEERNKRIARTKKGTYGKIAMVPAAFDPYQRVYICTHGWMKRKDKSRSKGKRPRRKELPLHIVRVTAPSQFWFVAQAQQGTAGDWKAVVKLGRFVHNHAVGAETFVAYPCARCVNDDRVAARVDGMLSVGTKRSRIYGYLLDHDQNVIMSDVDNMVRGHASSVFGKDDNDATTAKVTAFAAENPENVISTDETSAGETGVLSLTSAHMRQMFARFSELLLIGFSHKTNRYNYQVCTFMTMNEYGEGATVQHSLLEANSDWHMDRAVDPFKRARPRVSSFFV